MAWFAALAPLIPMIAEKLGGASKPAAPAVGPGGSPIDAIGGANLQALQGQLQPVLRQLLANQQLAQTQVEATAEHRNIVARQSFENEMRARLAALQQGQVRVNAALQAHILETSRGRGHGGGSGGGYSF